MSTDLNKIVKAYKNIRAARAANMKAANVKDAEFKSDLVELQNYMLSVLNDMKTKSVSTDEGTFFKKKVTTPTAADWNVFYKFIAENDAFDFLERRIKATAVEAYMKENEGKAPPGVNVYQEFEVRVRKAAGGVSDVGEEGED